MAGYDKTICLSPFFHAIYIVASSMVRMTRKNQMNRKAWKTWKNRKTWKTWKIRKIQIIRKIRKNRMAHGENRQTREGQYMKHQVNTIYKYA